MESPIESVRVEWRKDYRRWTVDVLHPKGPPERKTFKEKKKADSFAMIKRTELVQNFPGKMEFAQ